MNIEQGKISNENVHLATHIYNPYTYNVYKSAWHGSQQ